MLAYSGFGLHKFFNWLPNFFSLFAAGCVNTRNIFFLFLFCPLLKLCKKCFLPQMLGLDGSLVFLVSLQTTLYIILLHWCTCTCTYLVLILEQLPRLIQKIKLHSSDPVQLMISHCWHTQHVGQIMWHHLYVIFAAPTWQVIQFL